jgi:hypothetical protein
VEEKTDDVIVGGSAGGLQTMAGPGLNEISQIGRNPADFGRFFISAAV